MSTTLTQLRCPKCGSHRVAIISSMKFRDREARDRAMIRCRCVDCGHTFVVFTL